MALRPSYKQGQPYEHRFDLYVDMPRWYGEHRFVKCSSGITMAIIAQAAGVAKSTVSKALRDDPSISEAQRRRVRETAEALGYRPDPLVAALMARLHSKRRRNDPCHIAWLDLWPDEKEAALTADFNLMLRGATRRAEELGYRIEVHHVAREEIGTVRLHQILVTRCQWGLIIPPVPKYAMRYPLNLEGLAAVTIGTSLHEPVMHRVAANHFQGGQLACRKLREKGFRRVGLVLSPDIHDRVDQKWVGAYLAEQLQWPPEDRVPILLARESEGTLFNSWLARYRPDALLLAEPFVNEWLQGNQRPPRTAWLRILPRMPRGNPAIDTGPSKMGTAAVELVVGQIHRNERGSPQFPHTLLLDGAWRE